VVHVNWVCPLIRIKDNSDGQVATWSPPLFEQLDDEDSHNRHASLEVSQSASAAASAAAASAAAAAAASAAAAAAAAPAAAAAAAAAPPPPVVTRSGCVVKPVVHYGQVAN